MQSQNPQKNPLEEDQRAENRLSLDKDRRATLDFQQNATSSESKDSLTSSFTDNDPLSARHTMTDRRKTSGETAFFNEAPLSASKSPVEKLKPEKPNVSKSFAPAASSKRLSEVSSADMSPISAALPRRDSRRASFETQINKINKEVSIVLYDYILHHSEIRSGFGAKPKGKVLVNNYMGTLLSCDSSLLMLF